MMTSEKADPRVDVCLYFIPPHRLKEVDIEFMKQLSGVVPLIPIIAKADSMTTDELDEFRGHILRKAAKERISYHSFPNHTLINVIGEDTDADWPREGEVPAVATSFPPFAVVSSEQSATRRHRG